MGAGWTMETNDHGTSVLSVHDAIRSAILRGALEPGRVVSQLQLARELGVGRTPLREALRLLQREGLVTLEPNRRVRIAQLSVADAEEIYTMRITLEAVAIRLTIPNLTAEDFAELEGLYAQMDYFTRLNDVERLNAPHRAFHLGFVRGAGQRWVDLIGQLFDHAERYRLRFVRISPDGGAPRQAEHRAMLDAALAGDVERTVTCMARHYAHTATVVLSSLQPGYRSARLAAVLDMVAPQARIAQ